MVDEKAPEVDVIPDEVIGPERTLRQMFNLFFAPEIERRRAAGQLAEPFRVTGLIVIYSTSLATYFARPTPESNACTWRTGNDLPKLIQIQQSAIKSIEIDPLEMKAQDNCGQRHSDAAPVPTASKAPQKPRSSRK